LISGTDSSVSSPLN